MSTMSYLVIGLVILIPVLVILLVCAFVLPPRMIRRRLSSASSATPLPIEELLKAENDVRTSWLQFCTSLVLVIGVVVTISQITATQRATQSQLRLTQEGQISERFTTAIGQLGDAEKADVRLGGIYGLERVAHDSADYKDSVARVLAAYVRGHAPLVERDEVGEVVGLEELTGRMWALETRLPDVQAALTALGKDGLSTAAPPRLRELDLRGASLNDADLTDVWLDGANLTGAVLGGANLTGAVLSRATLTNAELGEANLTGARLNGANLTGAVLSGANLTGAVLGGATLTGALLNGATLTNAGLYGATLTNAGLYGADLSGTHELSQEQLNAAMATARPSFRRDCNGRSTGSTKRL